MAIKIVLFLSFIVLVGFLTAGCGNLTEEQKQELDERRAELVNLKDELKAAKKGFDSGELTAEEFKETKDNVVTAIKKAQNTMNKITASGTATTWEVLGYSLVAAIVGQLGFARGLPSKGPLAFIRRGLGGTVRGKEDS